MGHIFDGKPRTRCGIVDIKGQSMLPFNHVDGKLLFIVVPLTETALSGRVSMPARTVSVAESPVTWDEISRSIVPLSAMSAAPALGERIVMAAVVV